MRRHLILVVRFTHEHCRNALDSLVRCTHQRRTPGGRAAPPARQMVLVCCLCRDCIFHTVCWSCRSDSHLGSARSRRACDCNVLRAMAYKAPIVVIGSLALCRSCVSGGVNAKTCHTSMRFPHWSTMSQNNPSCSHVKVNSTTKCDSQLHLSSLCNGVSYP